MTTTELSEIIADVLNILAQRPDAIKQILDETLTNTNEEIVEVSEEAIAEAVEENTEETTLKTENSLYDKFEEYSGLNPDECVILDTETTGLGHGDKIVELSVIDLYGNTLYNQMFDPQMPMPDNASRVNGITDDMLKGKPTFEAELPAINKVLANKILIGWNVPFDEKMLGFEYAYVSQNKTWKGMWDAMIAFARSNNMKNNFGRYSCKLVKAKSMLGLGDSQEHRSLADCIDTLAVMKTFIGGETASLF